MGERRKYFKSLADGAKPTMGLPSPETIARMDKLSKSMTRLTQPSASWQAFATWKPSYLTSKPKFWSGVGDAFNTYGYFKPKYRFRNPHLADRQALFDDWATVSADLQRAARNIRELDRATGQARLFDPARLDKGA